MTAFPDPPLAWFSANTRGHDYVVGDIHGHLAPLWRLLDYVVFDESRDRVFCVGDLIDRGPDSAEALALTDKAWFFSVRGNHEQMMLDALDGKVVDFQARHLWMMNGGRWFEALGQTAGEIALSRARVLPLALAIETGADQWAGLVHAETPGADWAGFTAALSDRWARAEAADKAIWSRHQAYEVLEDLARPSTQAGRLNERVAGIAQVFHGHTPMAWPVAAGNRYWLDTGVFLADGGLSIARLSGTTPEVWCWPHEARTPVAGWQETV